ncbi:MAG: dual specificity protein phosphatase family protein [Deltaproteobacteria bacterium]|nr:dual specificity protein phosphatase family protein [Deltaproteobacteria bacterium]
MQGGNKCEQSSISALFKVKTYAIAIFAQHLSTKVPIGSVRNLADNSNVYLGMLPDQAIIKNIRDEITELTGKKSEGLDVISVIENFELGRAKRDMGIDGNIYVTGREDIEFLGDGRYRIEIDSSGESIRKMGINKWNQYATPDRTMLNRKVLEKAIGDASDAMKSGKSVYIHCKSGKGRSATVVVGARSSILIDTAKANKIQLTKNQIDQIIEEQISQVKSARSEIGISEAQKTNLKRVLYDLAIIRGP